ncbi:TetR/AcrR family transcriptional regulator [Boudabousia marimammalium]|uniref:HTH tetR-type domain-containing protein n=1 Tax=Boudabousia marimammalium TaxID=156892 RepID=A0A1Q5PS78_9ACTO|nr:TetR/AcrR family transcriptional regulator [Boudabousia marimammalium]OKL50431.1 hypothetical protein BM477_00175 [Boudabousia marimammalium]
MNIPDRPTARRVGLSKEKIVEIATKMSEEHGIDGWSMRSLAAETDVVPSVLYHYFANKDEVCERIIENLTLLLKLPSEDLEWKDWFTDYLTQMRRLLIRYHGVTEHLRQAKFPRASLPFFDLGMKKLEAAGFGKYAPLAHAMIMNVAVSAISARNVRIPETSGPHHQLTSALHSLSGMAAESEGLTSIIDNVLAPLAAQTDEETGCRFFELLVKSILSGVESVLLPLAQQES